MKETIMTDDQRRLANEASALASKVSGLALSVDQLDRRTKRSERVLQMTVLGLVLDFILSLLVGFALLSANQALHQEDVVRSMVLCPLYARFLGNYAPDSRAAGEDRQTYIDNYHVIQQGYGILNCTDKPVAPPLTPGAPALPTPPIPQDSH
jgi:hypothetical protein